MFGIDDVAVASTIGAGLSFLGGSNTNQANIDVANANNQWSAQQYATRYQTQVKDLEAAGLNPMLAYMQSPGSAPTAQPVTLGNPYHSAVQSYNEGMSTRGAYEKNISSAEQSRATVHQIDQSTNKIKQEIVNLQSDNDRVKQIILNLEEERQNLMKTGFNLTEQGNVLRGTISKLRAEVPWLNVKTEREDVLKNLDQLDLSAALKFENFGREFKQYEPIIQLLKSVLRR